jgi:hypothetical protein
VRHPLTSCDVAVEKLTAKKAPAEPNAAAATPVVAGAGSA